MSDYACASAILADVADLARAPRRIRVSEAAAQYLRVEVNGAWIQWDPELTPYMIEPMDCLASRAYEAVVFVGPARSGKTEALLDGWRSYIIVANPGDIQEMFASQILAHDYAIRRVDRANANSPELAARLSPRAHDDTRALKVYRSGMIEVLTWPTSSQVAQRDIKYAAASDYDSMTDDVGGEGDVFGLLRKRTQTYLSAGTTMIESSPKRTIKAARWQPTTPHEAPPTDGGILPIYNLGDRRMLYWRCLHCGAPIKVPPLPEYDDLPDLEAAADTARITCRACGAVHGPSDKRGLNRTARWVPDGCTLSPDGELLGHRIRTRIASFWLLGAAAAFQPWSSLVSAYLIAMRDLEATGAEERLKRTLNTDQALPYLPRAMQSTRSADDLSSRGETWDRGVVPPGVRFLIPAIDVQGRRFVVQVLGFGPGETWLIDRWEIFASPSRAGAAIDPASHPEDWAALAPVVQATYPLADGSGRRMPARLTVCDSGGQDGVTERAYTWWRGLRAQGLAGRVRLIKGDSQARPTSPRVVESYPDSHRSDRKAAARGDVPVLLLNTLILKDALNADLKRQEPGKGYVHFPEWTPREVYEELTAEVRGPKGWTRPGGVPNEAWDLMEYARAAAIWLGMEQWGEQWENAPPWARDWDKNPEIIPPEGRPSAGAQQREPAQRSAGLGRDDWVL